MYGQMTLCVENGDFKTGDFKTASQTVHTPSLHHIFNQAFPIFQRATLKNTGRPGYVYEAMFTSTSKLYGLLVYMCKDFVKTHHSKVIPFIVHIDSFVKLESIGMQIDLT